MFNGFFLRFLVRIGVSDDLTVNNADNSCGIGFGKLGIVCYHDDQTVFCDLLEKLHDLYAGFRVQSARRFVRKQNFGVIDQRSCDGDTLHLSARHLIRTFIQFACKPDLFQGFLCSAAAFRFGNARNGQRQLHVGKYGLMGNQIIALENKADGVVSVSVPIRVLEIFCGSSADDQIAARILVKSADDIQQGCFSASGGAENGNEFTLSERNGNAAKCGYLHIAGRIIFTNIP